MNRAAITLGFVAILVAGCGSSPPSPLAPLSTTISVQADMALNPDANGRASPVFMRLYALRDADALLAADFETIQFEEERLLEGAALHRHVLSLGPGERREVRWQLDPMARTVVAVAEFRDLNRSVWRAHVGISGARIEAAGDLGIAIDLVGTQVRMTLED